MKTISMIKPRKFFEKLFHKFSDDGTTDLAASLAYYFLLSLFPLLLFILTLLPYLQLDSYQVIAFVQNYAPGETGTMIADNIQFLLDQPKEGLLIISLLATLWTASGGIGALIRSLNRAYDATETRSFVKVKLLSIGLTVAMVIVIAITLILPVFGGLIVEAIASFIFIPFGYEILLQALRWIIGLSIMVFVLMMLYRLAPNTNFKLKEVFFGSVFATLTWQLISLGFSFYVTNFGNYEATYGAIGGIIILMTWFYITGIILIVGGQINATLYQLKRENQ